MLIPFLLNNGKYCIIDTEEKKKIGYREYDELDFFKEQFALFKIGNSFGYVYKDGIMEIILEPEYFDAKEFKNGIAAISNGNWQFINRNGILISKSWYSNYYHQGNGLIRVEKNWHTWETGVDVNGLIDNTGFEIVPCTRDAIIDVDNNFIRASYNGTTYLMNFYGEIISQNRGLTVFTPFENERAIAESSDGVFIIDIHFNKLFKLGNSSANLEYFLGGFKKGRLMLKCEKWGIVNSNGELEIDYKYDEIDSFIENLAIVGKEIDGVMKFSFIDSAYNEIIPFIYDEIKSFSEGLAAVRYESRWGFMNYQGEIIVPIEFQEVKNCKGGLCMVSIGDYRNEGYYGKWGFYDSSGRKICPLVYDDIYEFENETAIFKQNGKFGLISKNGIELTWHRYDDISYWKYEKFYWAVQSGKKFVIDEKGTRYLQEEMDIN